MAKAKRKKNFDVDRAHRIVFFVTFAVLLVSLGALGFREYQRHKASTPIFTTSSHLEEGSHE
jgi:hypothetical protein